MSPGKVPQEAPPTERRHPHTLTTLTFFDNTQVHDNTQDQRERDRRRREWASQHNVWYQSNQPNDQLHHSFHDQIWHYRLSPRTVYRTRPHNEEVD